MDSYFSEGVSFGRYIDIDSAFSHSYAFKSRVIFTALIGSSKSRDHLMQKLPLSYRRTKNINDLPSSVCLTSKLTWSHHYIDIKLALFSGT
jgi:hypothetical protein